MVESRPEGETVEDCFNWANRRWKTMVNSMVDRRMVAFGAVQLSKYHGYDPYYDYFWAGPLAGQYGPALLPRPHKSVEVD